MPLISIIIPIYNTEKFLPDCIKSVLNQSFTDFELILVDDGSTDNCSNICNAYSEDEPRIIVIHNKLNEGSSEARNAGISRATGHYLMFLDSDDFWDDKEALCRISEYIIKNPDQDVIMFQAKKYFESDNRIEEDKTHDNIKINMLTKHETIKYLITSQTYSMSACTKILKRDLILEYRIYFEKGLLGEDLDWFLRLITNVSNLYAIEENFYVYRMRPGSKTKSISFKNLEDWLYIIDKWEKCFLTIDIPQPFKKYYFGILAYAYVVGILLYSRLKRDEKVLAFPKMKLKSYLLHYSVNNKIRVTKFINRIFGIRITSFLLSKYMKTFRRD